MTDKTIDLDDRRGMAAQRATDLRRLATEVEVNRAALRQREEALEAQLISEPAVDWPQAAEKARYLMGLLAAMSGGGDARVQRLVAAVLADFERLAEARPVCVE
jgi:hypothetical protein